MALTDIVFNQAEGQDFILELGPGTLGTPADIVIANQNTGAIMEIPEGGSSIFIMSE